MSMTPRMFRDRLAAARGADAAEMTEAFEKLSTDVCAALAERNGSPPPVQEEQEEPERVAVAS